MILSQLHEDVNMSLKYNTEHHTWVFFHLKHMRISICKAPDISPVFTVPYFHALSMYEALQFSTGGLKIMNSACELHIFLSTCNFTTSKFKKSKAFFFTEKYSMAQHSLFELFF